MIAYHGKTEVKEKYLNRVEQHRIADQLKQGYSYWDKDASGQFRGCAVGCTLHSSDHGAYETELGIPRILARLEDSIFEALPVERAQMWPQEFLAAVPVGADLSLVWPRFAVWLMVDERWGVVNFARTEEAKTAVRKVAVLYGRQVDSDLPTVEEFRAAWTYASRYYGGAAAAAIAGVADAVASAASAVAADAASAANTAAGASAADAAADAASAVAADAASAAFYEKKCTETRCTARLAQADKLLELLAAAPVVGK